MIDNLKFIFSHSTFAILTGIFILIIFATIFIRTYNLKFVPIIIALCCLWWVILIINFPPSGHDYKIYKYNASLTLNGKNAFIRQNEVDTASIFYYHNPRYLDYTGIQHALYVLMTSIDLSRLKPKFSGFGFQVWTILNISTIILLIFYLFGPYNKEIGVEKFLPILYITFCPIIPYYLVISHWEDKLIFVLIPLLLLVLIKKGRLKTTSFILGFTSAMNGATILFVPIFLIFLMKKFKKFPWLNGILVLAGLFIAILPFFPDSLQGWANRFSRMNTGRPFWFSLYSFLPNNMYTPFLNTSITLIISLLTIVLYSIRKINLVDTLIISISIVIILSPFNVVSRVIPLILLNSLLAPRMNQYNWLNVGLILYIFILFDIGYTKPVVNVTNNILFHIPVLFSFALYILKRMKFSNEDLIINPSQIPSLREGD